MTRPDRRETSARLRVLLLSAGGLGLVPLLPGTVASLVTAGLLGLVAGDPLRLALMAGVLVAWGVWVTLRHAGHVTGPDGRGDPGWVVSDEVAGQAVACLGLLPFGARPSLLLAAFVLFRILDILKPPPVSTLERFHGARGVLLDDLAAGAMAALLVLALGASDVLPA